MPTTFPKTNYTAGWPESLVDVDGNRYVRVRDGTPTGDFSGHSCLYALVGADNRIVRNYLYIPLLGSTAEEVRMSGGSWLSPEAAATSGVPPIVLPAEPIAAAATRTRGAPRALSLPLQSSDSGWPASVKDNAGVRYVRVRDGSSTGPFSGHSCLYAKLDERNMIVRDHQYVPVLGSTVENLLMSGGSWLSPEAAKAAGVPPIQLPPEPVRV